MREGENVGLTQSEVKDEKFFIYVDLTCELGQG
jgi:hypothetical protein